MQPAGAIRQCILHLLLKKKANGLISGAVTDDAGRFGIIGIPEGQYLVRFTYLGYEAGEMDLLVGELNRNFDLGTIGLVPASRELEGVTVLAERPDVSPDMEKKTFYMDENYHETQVYRLEFRYGF